MQRPLAVAAILAILVVGPVGAASEIRFSSPGAFAGKETLSRGGHWLLLVFEDEPASFDLPLAVPGVVENTTLFFPFYAQNRSVDVAPQAIGLHSNHTMPGGSVIHLGMRAPSSLYVEADNISFSTGTVAGKIAEKDALSSTEGFTRFKDRRDRLQLNHNPPASAVLQYEPENGTGFDLQVEGARRVEWHGTETSCEGTEWCPDGGPRTTQRVASVHDMNVSAEKFSYQSVEGAVQAVQGGGRFAYAVLGGDGFGLTLRDGSLRLPLATATMTCPSCAAPQNQTLTVTGDVDLAGLRRTGDATLAVRFDGDLATAKLDEASIDPRALLGISAASVAAVALGLVVLWKVLGLLFTKWHEDDLLRLPRRRAIHDAIHAHPGITFRELTRETGLATGTVRHHLPILLRHGKIVEKRDGKVVRYFENHGKFDRGWRQVSTLRDEVTLRVHDWLVQHQNSTQQDILRALKEQGVSHTATQRRLNRLLDAGLATAYPRGRFKVYRAL